MIQSKWTTSAAKEREKRRHKHGARAIWDRGKRNNIKIKWNMNIVDSSFKLAHESVHHCVHLTQTIHTEYIS